VSSSPPRLDPPPAAVRPSGLAAVAARAPLGLWITVLALLTAVAPLATDMYLPALPEVAAQLGSSASAIQLTLTAFLVGLAAGQLVIGPLSDGWGRRRLLLAGTVLCLVASVACAVAPTTGVLVVARFLQGFGGAAGVVLSRAVITDRTTGDRAVRLFSVMMAINGIAPVVAPLLGSSLLGVVGWRGIFLALALLALLMALGAAGAVPETLPAERRVRGGLRRTGRDVRSAFGRRRYLGYTLAFALAFATMFAYISGSPFVLQETLGLSTGWYALAFGVNAAGLTVASLVGGRLVGRVGARRLLAVGVAALLVLAVAYLVVVLAGAPRWPALVVLFLAVTSLGLVLGNGAALASAEVRDIAGTGSALLGALQFGLGAVVSPLVGSSPLVMAVVMVVASGLAVLALATLARDLRGAAA
jgi:DHA1 family bicyclomycin/chloramphenicol resistance-like MFS transporter